MRARQSLFTRGIAPANVLLGRRDDEVAVKLLDFAPARVKVELTTCAHVDVAHLRDASMNAPEQSSPQPP